MDGDTLQQSQLHAADSSRAMFISVVPTDMCKFSHKISSRPTSAYAVHNHPFHELIYILSGQVDFFIAGHVFPVNSGTLMTFPPGVMHGVMVKSDAPYERYTIHFDERMLSMERRRLLMSSMPSELLGVAAQQQAEHAIWRNMENSGILQLLEAMEVLHSLEQEKLNELMPIYLEAVLAALIPRAARERSDPAKETRPQGQLEQIVTWVDQHYTEPISLDTLADRFYLSKGYLSTLFRQATGSSLKEYIRNRRMSHVQLLLSSGMPISQAASRVGFSDYTTFYRAYVRSFGHAPSTDCNPGERDALLERALSAPGSVVPAGNNAIVFPENGTEKQDPSMINAVEADKSYLPDGL